VTVNLLAFIELLMTMAIGTKHVQNRCMDPSCNWGQSGGYDIPKVQGNSRKQGELGNRLPPEGSVT